MPLSYTPAVTGSAIDGAIKAKTANLKGQALAGAGGQVWQAALQQLYADFDTTLATAVMAYLQTAQVVFPPGIPVPLAATLPAFALSAMAPGSGTAIDGAIKSQTANLKGQAVGTAGVTVWTEFCRQVGADLLSKVPGAVVMACASGVPMVPPGFTAPPMVASLAPAPPIYTGLLSAQLQGLMAGFFQGGIASLGAQIDSRIKGECSQLKGQALSSVGASVWQAAIDILCTNINLQLGVAIGNFMRSSVGKWQTTPVPGNPITPGGPTPGGAPAPATIVIT